METENPPESSPELTKEEITINNILYAFKPNIMRCVKCPMVAECAQTKKNLEALQEKAHGYAEDVYEEEIELDDSADNAVRAQFRRDQVFNDYIEHYAGDILKDKTCIYEQQELLKIVGKFVNAGYNLNDPRAYIIITELLNNILIQGRTSKAFISLGIILRKDTPAGPIYYSNPILRERIAFSKLIVEATESLDRILKSDESAEIENDFTKLLINSIKKQEKEDKLLLAAKTEND